MLYKRLRGRGTPRKTVCGCVACFPKSLRYENLWFPLPTCIYMTWPKISYPIYDHCGWHSCSKHNLWRAHVDGLIHKKMEKLRLASSRKHINQFKTRVQKPKPSIHDQNGNNWYPIYVKNSWKTIPSGDTHTSIAYIRKYPPWDERLDLLQL